MKVVITGGQGFLGWHLACRLRAVYGLDAVRLGRDDFADSSKVMHHVAHADVVVHLAGVNRAESDDAVRVGNIQPAQLLADAVVAAGRGLRLVYSSSIQAELEGPYGEGKAKAAELLQAAVRRVGGSMANVLLPNLFGEHGRPQYNSFVATFCHAVAHGNIPTVTGDRQVPLLHAQRAAQHLIDAMHGTEDERLTPEATSRSVSEVLGLIGEFHEQYANGEIPALTDAFRIDLFNTYRSYTFPQQFPLNATVHADHRGELFETSRTHGGTGQTFVSTTKPGATRGDHYHLNKVERFFVVRGEAEISLRRLLHDEVVRFRVNGSAPGFVDMPTMWVHNITNVGDDDLITMFWADQLLDPANPDQYSERVFEGARA